MSHYECNNCGHTFLEPCIDADDNGDEWVELCKLCESDNISLVVDKLTKCETLIAVWSDYFNHIGLSKNETTQRLSKLNKLKTHYLNN